MRLMHFSHAPLGEIVSRAQPPASAFDPKPHGLWLSVEDPDTDEGWADYCAGIRWPVGDYAYEVTLDPAVPLLRLTSLEQVVRFANQYAADPAEVPGLPTEVVAQLLRVAAIDWRRVAADHPGILIAPFQRRLRGDYEFRWYYGWDCASGCVWDARAIAGVRLVDYASEGVDD